MLTLCGFSASNYYNKVKLALLEKGLPFTEELAWVGETDRSASPLGKVPYLRTPQGPLCESAVMADYIEAAHPEHPLIPADPYQAAKVRELIDEREGLAHRPGALGIPFAKAAAALHAEVPGADEVLVVGNDNANGHDSASTGSTASTTQPPSGAGRAVRDPPRSWARSAMPSSPKPAWGVAPDWVRPSSVTRNRMVAPSRRTSIATRVGLDACRRALVKDSCASR